MTSVQELLKSVSQYYGYLFTDFGFKPSVAEMRREGENMLVVLKSPELQFKIYVEAGTPETAVGLVDAPVVWSTSAPGSQGWYLVDPVIAYLNRKFPEREIPYSDRAGERTTQEIIESDASRLRPHIADIAAAFASGLSVEWWEDYKREFARRVARIRQR